MWKLRFAFMLGLLSGTGVYAQSEDPRLTLSYSGNYLIHPGLRVGYEYPLRSLDSGSPASVQLFLHPQIGTFTIIDRNFNVLVGSDVGIRRQKEGKKSASALSLGLHFLGESEKLGFAVDLGSGDRSNVEREWRSYLLPTLNYEWSTSMGQKNRFFTKFNWGYALNTNRESEMYLLIDLGIKFSMKKI